MTEHGPDCPCYDCTVNRPLPKRIPHIYTPKHDPGRMCPTCGRGGRPFEGYRDQPDTAERTRLAVQAIPFALLEKRNDR